MKGKKEEKKKTLAYTVRFLTKRSVMLLIKWDSEPTPQVAHWTASWSTWSVAGDWLQAATP